MTFIQVVIATAVVALLCTLILKFFTKRVEHVVVSFLQNFCGLLFVFSGLVKAVDPLGTAYKMEQYFAEFKATFEGTWFGFMADVFPWMSEHSIAFSVLMIVLEIVVGVMLVIGARPKLTSWTFFLVILFFTALTGFTFLTGFVPSGENFFSLSKWGPYVKSNMRVTDCGCFGDYLKIEPKMSFFKDVVLMVPALILLFKSKDMHQLFSTQARDVISGLATVMLIWYCLSNFSWDLPHKDFRPFAEGLNIRDNRNAEMDAMNNVEVTGYRLKEIATGRIVELGLEEFIAGRQSTYSKDQYEMVDQIKTTPAVVPTKLSEFLIEDLEGYEVSDDLMNDESDAFWVVCYKVPFTTSSQTENIEHQYWRLDTIVDGQAISVDTTLVTEIRDTTILKYTFKDEFLEDLRDQVLSKLDALKKSTYVMFGGVDPSAIEALMAQLDTDAQAVVGDDILLKTIIRSNPGVVWVRDGRVMKKWHKQKLPALEELREWVGN